MPSSDLRRARRRAGIARSRLSRALPARAEILFGSLGWAAAMAASAVFELLRGGWTQPGAIVSVALVFGLGGLIGFPLALIASRVVRLPASPEVRFATALLSLAGATLGITGAIYALWYRDYYAEWHEAALTIGWIYQFVFTTAGAFYQFAVLGLRLYLPFAFLCLIGVSAWLAGKAGRR